MAVPSAAPMRGARQRMVVTPLVTRGPPMRREKAAVCAPKTNEREREREGVEDVARAVSTSEKRRREEKERGRRVRLWL